MSSAYEQGYDAGERGVKSHKNPYKRNTSDYKDWLEGWHDAQADNYGE